MAEAENGGPKPALSDVELVPPMTFWEKVGFLALPVVWALLMPITALLFIALTLPLLLHPRDFFNQFLDQSASLQIFMVASYLLFAAILIYPVRFFRKMFIRKRKTGSILPVGGELAALWFRKKRPPLWMRIYAVSFFCLIACSLTYKTIVPPAHHPFAAWGAVAIFWLIPITATIDVFWPRKERLWTGFVASGAFGALAIMAAVAIIHQGYHGAGGWIGLVLFASLSVLAAIMTVRDAKRMRGAPAS